MEVLPGFAESVSTRIGVGLDLDSERFRCTDNLREVPKRLRKEFLVSGEIEFPDPEL